MINEDNFIALKEYLLQQNDEVFARAISFLYKVFEGDFLEILVKLTEDPVFKGRVIQSAKGLKK